MSWALTFFIFLFVVSVYVGYHFKKESENKDEIIAGKNLEIHNHEKKFVEMCESEEKLLHRIKILEDQCARHFANTSQVVSQIFPEQTKVMH